MMMLMMMMVELFNTAGGIRSGAYLHNLRGFKPDLRARAFVCQALLNCPVQQLDVRVTV